jgi:Glycine rich protein
MAPIFTGGRMGFGRVDAAPSGTIVASWENFTQTATFSYTGSDQTWTVPASTTAIGVFIWGAAGGSYYGSTRTSSEYSCGGSGGYTEAIIQVIPGETLYIVVGQGGVGSNFAPASYGGGGKGGGTPRGAGEWGTAGGGLSGVFAGPGTIFTGATQNPPAIPRAMAIAGGGGGYGLGGQVRIPTGFDCDTSQLNPEGLSLPGPSPLSYVYGNMYHAAGGGGLRGENAGRPANTPVSSYPYSIGYPGGTAAGGGSQSTGGTQVDGNVDGSAGSQLRGGDASNSPYEYGGGGGGGGWYGGGAGASSYYSPTYGPGGAGSGFIGNTTLTYPGTGSSFSNRWTGTSPHNSRNYSLAFTTNAPRATGPLAPGNSPIYTSPNSSPYYPGSAGKAPATGPGALTGNPGYVVIRY